MYLQDKKRNQATNKKNKKMLDKLIKKSYNKYIRNKEAS